MRDGNNNVYGIGMSKDDIRCNNPSSCLHSRCKLPNGDPSAGVFCNCSFGNTCHCGFYNERDAWHDRLSSNFYFLYNLLQVYNGCLSNQLCKWCDCDLSVHALKLLLPEGCYFSPNHLTGNFPFAAGQQYFLYLSGLLRDFFALPMPAFDFPAAASPGILFCRDQLNCLFYLHQELRFVVQ